MGTWRWDEGGEGLCDKGGIFVTQRGVPSYRPQYVTTELRLNSMDSRQANQEPNRKVI